MRAYVVPIVAAALAVFLGYRQWSLERRVEVLIQELGSAGPGPDEIAPPAPERDSLAAHGGESHAGRLRTLETALASVRADVRSLEKATGDMAPVKPVSDQQILSVMKQQGAKFMETQLAYHRERWLDQREVALNDFSRRFGLNSQQSDQLWRLASSEIDKMVEILRKPESFENPERFALEWKRILLDTDAGVHRVLDQQKAVAWDQARFVERKLLWPWLPE